MDSITALVKSADKFAVDAELSGNITLLSKSNALCWSAKEKSDELDVVNKVVADKEALLKQCQHFNVVLNIIFLFLFYHCILYCSFRFKGH